MGLSCAEVCVCEEGGSEWEGEDTQSWGLTSQSESSEDEPDFFWLDASQAGHEEKAQRRETGKKTETEKPKPINQEKEDQKCRPNKWRYRNVFWSYA